MGPKYKTCGQEETLCGHCGVDPVWTWNWCRSPTEKVAKDDDDRQENCLLFLAEGLLFEGIVN